MQANVSDNLSKLSRTIRRYGLEPRVTSSSTTYIFDRASIYKSNRGAVENVRR